MKGFRRWLLAMCVLCGLAELIGRGEPNASLAADRPKTTKLRVGFGSTAGSMTPLWVAVKKGLFRKHGLDVEIVWAQTSVGMAALISGETQLTLNDGTSAIQAIAGGAPLKIIAYFNKLNPYAIVARPEIQRPEELRGKKVALLKPGDTTEISARMALKPYNMAPGRDYTALSVGNSPARLAALLSGSVSAALLSGAYIDAAVKEGMRVLFSLEKERIPYIATGVTVREDFAKRNPDSVIAFLRAMIDGVRFFADQENKSLSVEIMAMYQRSDPTDKKVQQAYEFYYHRLAADPFPDEEGAHTILSALQAIDAVRYGKLAAKDVIDPTYMEKVRASGFLTGK